MRATLKFLHEVATVGCAGGAAAQLLVSYAPSEDPRTLAALRAVALDICHWITLPSLALALVSGLLSLALHRAFQSAEWVWAKALMTPLLLEGTVIGILGPARSAAELTAAAAAGEALNVRAMAETLRIERYGLLLMLALFGAQIALAVWRPRVKRPA